jgi:RNA polymerase sigma-70 factor (ECF subfamily)
MSLDDDAVLRQHEGAVRRYCHSRLRNPDDAEDAVQDTFMRWIRRPVRDVPNPEAWLIAAAAWSCKDVHRRLGRDEKHVTTPDVRDPAASEPGERRIADTKVADPEELAVQQDWIQRLLERLGPRDRLVIEHLYLIGSSLSEVAEELGITVEHARVIAMRARQRAQIIVEEMNIRQE